jgi:hypothetical protein
MQAIRAIQVAKVITEEGGREREKEREIQRP